MKGINTFRLNDETVIEAIEYWLNNTQFAITAPVKVRSFSMRDGYIHVDIEAIEAEAEESAYED